LLKEIDETTRSLRQTREDKEKSLQNYLTLQAQVVNRQQLLGNLQQGIRYTEDRIVRTELILHALQEDLDNLYAEYQQMMRGALRNRIHRNLEALLFSARDLNQFFQRLLFFRQYENYRRRQVTLIQATKKTLEYKSRQLTESLAQKEQLLATTRNQERELGREMDDKNRLLTSLKDHEKNLAISLEDQLRQRLKLENAIERVIRSEMEAAARRQAATAKTERKASAASSLGASSFQQAKGNLPWPVEEGQVIRPFGTQQHPDFKDVKTVNNGIDILSAPRAVVKVVFPGKVVGTQLVPGFQYTVIVQHDDFYTVYANLENVLVKRGDMLKANQSIGNLSEEKPEMHFELWKEKQRLNPTDWIQ